MEAATWSATMNALGVTFADLSQIETMTVRLGHRNLPVAVARTPLQWATGLVGHEDIDAMLFIMPSGSRLPFQMRDVERDLLIAFFDDDGTIVDLDVMVAHTGFKQPTRPYTYVLEIAGTGDLTLLEDLARGLYL